jgi:hypothetical protein
MKTFSLLFPQMIDPLWLREVQGAHREACAHHYGATLNRIHFHFRAGVVDCPADETAMEAWLGRNVLGATKAAFGNSPRAISFEPQPAAGI